MKYKNYTAEDFFADENFRKWITQNDPALNYFWEKWLMQNPDKSEEVALARKMVLSLKFKDENISPQQKENLWQNIRQQQAGNAGKIRPIASNQIERKPKSFAWYFYRAAAILLLVVTAWFLLNGPVIEQEPIIASQLVVKENPPGQKSRIHLSDGSVVQLNANSSIKYLEDFEPGQRIVHLSGEAFFQVAKDSLRPFTVISGEISTTALGTQFNVSAFPGQEVVKVNLLEGKVEVKEKTGQQSLVLNEKQAVHYQAGANKLQKATFNYAEAIAWKDGILYFQKSSLPEVISRLQRWYGVQISILGSPAEPKVISGRFENESLENVLQSISFPGGFDYEINGKNVSIKF